MNTRFYEPKFIFDGIAPGLSDDHIEKVYGSRGSDGLFSRPHNAINHIIYLSYFYKDLGLFCEAPPSSIPEEIERLRTDVLSVFGFDIYQPDSKEDTIKLLLHLIPTAGQTQLNDLEQLRNLKDYSKRWASKESERHQSKILPSQTDINAGFLDNLEQTVREKRNLAEPFDCITEQEKEYKRKLDELSLQDQISFLNRECENMKGYYGNIILEKIKKDKDVLEVCKNPDGSIKSTDEIVDQLTQTNDTLKNYINKNPKNLGETIEKYKLIRAQHETLQGNAPRTEKLKNFSDQFDTSEEKIKSHRDNKLIRFAKACLFVIAIVPVGVMIGMTRTYNSFFQPRGEAYINKLRHLVLIQPKQAAPNHESAAPVSNNTNSRNSVS